MPIMFTLLGPSVTPVDEIQMKPCLMMATLISRSQAECSTWEGECTVHAHLPKSIGTRWFEKSTYSPDCLSQNSSGLDFTRPYYCTSWLQKRSRRQLSIAFCPRSLNHRSPGSSQILCAKIVTRTTQPTLSSCRN